MIVVVFLSINFGMLWFLISSSVNEMLYKQFPKTTKCILTVFMNLFSQEMSSVVTN